MAKGEDITTRFKADISEFKSAITQANRIIKENKAELKNLDSEMQLNGKSSEALSKKIDVLRKSLESQKSKLEAYQNQLKTAQKYEQESANSITALKEALEKAKTEYGENSDEVNDYKEQLNSAEKAHASLETQVSNLKISLTNQKTTVNQTQGELNKLESDLTSLESAEQSTSDNADELSDSLKESGESANNASGGFTVMKGALASLVADGIRKAVDAIKDFAKATIDVGKQFDSSMSQVAAVSGASGAELETLRDKAKEMGETTKFSASEAADAFNYMAMAGWKTEDMISGIDGILSLAAASGTDLATTSDIVTDALTAMGYSAGDAGRLADVMAAASSNANTNVQMMGATFQYAAPIVGALGYSMEDTAVAIGLMANAGIKGEQAGTALRSIMTRLASPPKEAADAMDQLGISITNADGTMKPLNEILGDLRSSFSGLSEAEQAQISKSLAGQEAMSGLLAIVNAAPSDFDKLTDAVRNSEGAANDMATTMQDNLGGDLTQLGSKLEGIQLSMYEKFEPALRSGVDVLDSLLNALSFVVDHSGEVISALGAMATGIGAYLAYTTAITVMTQGWQALVVVQKAVTAAQWLMNAAMTANPIGLVVAAVAALVAGIILLWNNSEEFREFWIGLWDKVKTVCTDAWEGIKAIWTTVSEWFNTTVIEPVKEFFSAMWEAITGFFTTAWDGIVAVWETVAEWFNTNVIEPLKEFFTAMWDRIKELASSAWDGIKNVWNVVSGWFNNTIISPITDFFSGMWDRVKTGASNAWEGIKETFSVVSDWFKNTFSDAWQKVKDVFSTGGKIFDGIKDGILSGLKTVINAIIRGMNKVIKIPFDGLNSALDHIRNISFLGISPFTGLGSISVPQIPELARGGILGKGQVGLLEGNGAEAVVPLERNKYWIAAVVEELKRQLNVTGLLSQLQGSLGLGTTTSTVTNATNNFTQIINAPKQPSRIELYRQTKNLLNLKGGN